MLRYVMMGWAMVCYFRLYQVMAGGAIRGGKVYGDWPGLGEGDLYQDRDLMPTQDVRAMAAYVMRGLFGTSKTDLSSVVFPGLQLPHDPGLIL